MWPSERSEDRLLGAGKLPSPAAGGFRKAKGTHWNGERVPPGGVAPVATPAAAPYSLLSTSWVSSRVVDVEPSPAEPLA